MLSMLFSVIKRFTIQWDISMTSLLFEKQNPTWLALFKPDEVIISKDSHFSKG